MKIHKKYAYRIENDLSRIVVDLKGLKMNGLFNMVITISDISVRACRARDNLLRRVHNYLNKHYL